MSGSASRETTNADAWIGLAAGLWNDAAGNQGRPVASQPDAVLSAPLVPVVSAIEAVQPYAALTGPGSAAPIHQAGALANPAPVVGHTSQATTPPNNPAHAGVAVSSAAPGAGAPTPGSDAPVRPAALPANRLPAAGASGPGGSSDSLQPHTLAATGALVPEANTITPAASDAMRSYVTSGGTFAATSSQMLVSNGSTEVIQGDLAEPTTMIVVDGIGSELTIGGTLTTGAGGTYTYYASRFPSSVTGALVVINGGTVQLGGLVLDPAPATPFANTIVDVDSSSAIEIGNAANAVAGAIVIDAGHTLTALTTAGLYGNLIDNGTVLVSGGTLTQSGAVSGSGLVEIARGATWLLDGTIAPSVTISFLDSGAVLGIGGEFSFTDTDYSSPSYALGDLLTGFRPGDAIELYDPITRADFTAGTNGNPGTLNLIDGNTTVEVLHLSGNFTGETFNVTQTASGGSVITLLQGPASAAQATNADPYSWNAAGGGAWNSAGNWLDGATAGAAAFVPGSQTQVTIAGPASGQTDTITGGGTSASVTLTGSVDLVGCYQVGGVVTVGTAAASSGQGTTAGSLGLAAGTTVTAASVNTFAGMFWQAAGTSMTTAGSVLVGSASAGTITSVSTLGLASGALLGIGGDLLVNAGALVDAGGVVTVAGTASLGIAGDGSNAGAIIVNQGGSISVGGGLIDTGGILVADGFGAMLSGGTLTASGNGSYTAESLTTPTEISASVAAVNGGTVQVAGAVLSNASLLVDTSSAIEIGTAGGAAAGAITVDANRVVSVGGGTSTLGGALVNNGTIILANGTLVQAGGVSGTGTFEIGANATLVLDAGIAATDTITCLGGQAAIAFAGSGPMNATLTGFTAGDALDFSQPVTGVLYTPGAAGVAGTLTVTDGATTLATLGVIGDETGWAFAATSSGNGTIVSLVTNTATLGVQLSGSGSMTQSGNLQVIDLGTVPMGSADPSDTIGIANLGTLTAGALNGNFTLVSTAGFLNSGFASGFSGLAAGQSDLQPTVTLSTNNAGVFAETIVVTPFSIGNASTIALSPQTIEVTGTVALVSAALGVRSLGTAALSQSGAAWLLNLGTVALGAASLSDTIGIANLGTGAGATLSGSFNLSGTSGFSNTGFGSGFSGLGAGQSETQQTISLATGTAGVFTETIVINSSSTAGSSSTVLPSQTITVTGTVVIPNLSYTLTNAPTTIVAGLGNDSFSATSGVLNSQDSLNGGAGTNTLNLLGVGSFDLGAPATLVNIQTVTATEGSSSNPTVIYMRNGSGMTVNLSPASGGNGAAVIYGANASDVFNLAGGSDTVVLGSAAEGVHAGGGTAVIQAAASLAGAVVTGGTVGTTTLAITSGGTATLSGSDTHLTVTLSAATHLNLGSAQFITAIGSGQQDTITAGAANQTLVATGGNAVLVGYAPGGDTFTGLAAGLNGELIQNFGGGDIIDITDLGYIGQAATLAVSGAGNNVSTALTLTDGTHRATVTLQGYYTASQLQLGSDLHGGLQVVAS